MTRFPLLRTLRLLTRRTPWRTVGLALALLALGGCAGIPSSTPGSGPATAIDDEGTGTADTWYYLRFRFPRNEDDEVDRHLDLLVANEVVAPVLAANRSDIRLWRFHRRWPRDETGHQFSFIVLTDATTLRRIDSQISARPPLRRLRADGLLREYRIDVARGEDPGALEATSDRNWSLVLQREWPHFIMGASRMWLGLVQAEVARVSGQDLYARYADASEVLDALWFDEGNHALFHHLSALFGYRPLRVIRRDVMTF